MTVPDVRQRFEAALPFALDPFQERALDALDAGHSVLVAAPTGSGKTLVAEYAIARTLAASGKSFYTTPLKALSNQKFGDLRRAHGPARVGLLTGDNSVNGEAPVVVMTTEVLRNMIYEASPTLDGLQAVVLDEVHYLQDPSRGAVWEEVIVHLPLEVRLVCLSATVSNAEEFGDWIRTVRGGTEVVIEDRRPVELRHLYGVAFRGSERIRILPTFVDAANGAREPNPEAARLDAPTAVRGRRGGRPLGLGPTPPRRADVVDRLAEDGMVPAISFIFSRGACDDAVGQCLAAGLRLTSEDERVRIRAIAERHCRGLDDRDLRALGYGEWLAGLEAGLASHHAGKVPPMKEAVEEAFAAGLVKVVFATETLSLGINMPARTVVIERLTKFGGERHEVLTPGEYTQLTGRAGRRGIDEVGYAVALWNRWVAFEQVAALASRRTYELTSSFRPTYNMATNLVRRYEREHAHHLLNLSFAQYRTDRGVVRLERATEETERRLEEARRRAGCDRGDVSGYRRLQRELATARQRGRRPGRVESALAALRPGDVVQGGDRIGPVVVLGRGRGGRGTWLSGLSIRAKPVRLGHRNFAEPPQPIGRIELPRPYRPKSPEYRRRVAAALRRIEPSPPARTGRAPGGGGGRRDADTFDALARAVEHHPVASCPEVREHLRNLDAAERAERELARVRSAVRRHADNLARLLDRVLEILEARGYVEGWTLTDAGRLLSRLYAETDLLLAEALRAGLFDDLDPPGVAALAACFTHEPRGSDGPSPEPRWPEAALARRWRDVEALWSDLVAHEEAAGLMPTRRPDSGFADLAHAWARGEALHDLLGYEEMTGGDFVRNVKQVIDLLGQIADALPGAVLAETAREAAASLFRGVVEASSRVPALEEEQA